MHKPIDPKLIDSGQSLVPWFVNGTLSEIEVAKLNQLKNNSVEFEQEIQRERELAKALVDKDECLNAVLAQQSVALNTLKQRINKDKKHSLLKLVSKKVKRNSYYGYGIAASFFLLVGLSLGLLLPSENQDFYVLTDGPVAEGQVLQLIFENDASVEELSKVLSDKDVMLLSGPSSNGVYRVQINADENVGRQLRAWQQDPSIRWAEVEPQ